MTKSNLFIVHTMSCIDFAMFACSNFITFTITQVKHDMITSKIVIIISKSNYCYYF